MDDICANNHGGDPCSVAANPSHWRKAIDCERVYEEAVRRGKQGAISQELYNACGLSENTGAARCSDLKAAGRLIRTSRRGITTSGKKACVLVADIHWDEET